MANSQEKSRLSILLTSARMAVATFCSRILGLVREQLIAATFGASGLTDAFYVAYRIPNMLRDLFAEGAFSSAFVPIFTESKIKNKSQETFNQAFWALFIITSILSIIIFLTAPFLVKFIAPGFDQDMEKFNLTVLMVRIISPFLMLISLAALLMGVLNTYKIFFLPALTPVFLNLSVICSILFLANFLENQGIHSIISISIGILIGGFLQLALQIPTIRKHGYSFKFPNKLLSPNVKRILYKMGPGTIGYSFNQVNMLINTALAVTAGTGAVAWLNWGFRLFQFPNGVLSVSIGNSHLVHFSNAWKSNKKDEASKTFISTVFLTLSLLIPITIIILLYSDWIINIVFERGKFTRNDTMMASKALFFYSLSLPFYGLYKISVPIFYAIDKEKIPVITSIISVVVNISIALSLINIMGFSALALSASCAVIANLSLQIYYLKKYIAFSLSDIFSLKLAKFIFTAFLIFFLGLWIKPQVEFFSESIILKLLIFALISLVLVGSFLGILFILGERNFIYVRKKKN